jgi:transglutaminase-like putative cysteine protease
VIGRLGAELGLAQPADWRIRALALGSTLALIATALSVYYSVTEIVGGTDRLTAVVIVAFVVATVLAGVVEERTANLLGVSVFAVGIGWYLLSTPVTVDSLLAGVISATVDAVALATGNSVLGIAAASRWAAATAPTPVFLTWYFALRGQYGRAAGIGGALVCYFVLTTDLLLGGLVGIVAAFCTVGFGELEHRGGDSSQTELLVVLLAVMTVVGLSVTVLPASGSGTVGSSSGLGTGSASPGSAEIEASLLSEDGSLTVQGPISLSPAVRFTITADEPARWRVGTYDRYTGDGWVRTEGTTAYDGAIEPSPGPSERNRQRIRFEAAAAVMPAAAQPVTVGQGVRDRTRVTAHGSLTPTRAFEPGDQYTVVSETPTIPPQSRFRAAESIPDRIRQRYTQVPGATPDRVGALTDDLTANTTTAYETVTLIEAFLEREKAYSLDVQRPDGRIADSFLFEMDAGYCTYYATTMVTMLRTQEIPARLAVGYNTGQRVAENQWVVRGSDAHAWVEVYLPDAGWVGFDPTPAAGWTDARQQVVSDARTLDTATEVDTSASAGRPYVSAETTQGQTDEQTDQTDDSSAPSGNETAAATGDRTPGDRAIARSGSPTTGQAIPSVSTSDYERADGGVLPAFVPGGIQLAVGAVLLAGAVAGLRTTGLLARGRRWRRLYRQRPGQDPNQTAIRAAARVEHLLARDHRPRRPAETRHEYVSGLGPPVDDRVETVFDLATRAEYGDGITTAQARTALAHADELVRSKAPLGRLAGQRRSQQPSRKE